MPLKTFLSFFLFAALSAFGQTKISGTVLKWDSTLLANATVKIFANDSLVATAVTPNDGSFQFELKGEENIKVEISADGYKTKHIENALSATPISAALVPEITYVPPVRSRCICSYAAPVQMVINETVLFRNPAIP